MNYIDIVKETIDIIEENLHEQLSLDSMAGRFYTTKYHYCRIFKAVTSMSIIDYYRRRRLSEATLDILNSKKSIIDIALDYGYNSHGAFTRAYRQCFNESPSSVRKNRTQIDLQEKIEIMERNFKNYKNSIMVEYKILNKEESELWGLKKEIDFEPQTIKSKTIESVEQFLMLSEFLDTYYFIIFPDSELHGKLNYGIYIDNKEKNKGGFELEQLILPAAKYIEIEYCGKMEENWENVLADISMLTGKMKLERDESVLTFYQEFSTKNTPTLIHKIYIPIK